MRYFFRILFCVMLGSSVQAQAAGWICNFDYLTGFKYAPDADKWFPTNFAAPKPLVISPASNEPSIAFEVKRLGNQEPHMTCSANPNVDGYMLCSGGSHGLYFNEKTLRFQTTYSFGYVTDDLTFDPTRNTPSIGIGVCSPL